MFFTNFAFHFCLYSKEPVRTTTTILMLHYWKGYCMLSIPISSSREEFLEEMASFSTWFCLVSLLLFLTEVQSYLSFMPAVLIEDVRLSYSFKSKSFAVGADFWQRFGFLFLLFSKSNFKINIYVRILPKLNSQKRRNKCKLYVGFGEF